MCDEDLPVAVDPLWHDAQSVEALNPLWSTLAEDQLLVLLWQLSQLPLTPAWIAFDGLPSAGGNAPVWQVAHCEAMVALLCTLAGVQLA